VSTRNRKCFTDETGSGGSCAGGSEQTEQCIVPLCHHGNAKSFLTLKLQLGLKCVPVFETKKSGLPYTLDNHNHQKKNG